MKGQLKKHTAKCPNKNICFNYNVCEYGNNIKLIHTHDTYVEQQQGIVQGHSPQTCLVTQGKLFRILGEDKKIYTISASDEFSLQRGDIVQISTEIPANFIIHIKNQTLEKMNKDFLSNLK